MTIELLRLLPDTSLSRFRIRDMRPEEVIKIECDNAAEFNAAMRTARDYKSIDRRTDGFKYKVESDSAENTVKISLFKEE